MARKRKVKNLPFLFLAIFFLLLVSSSEKSRTFAVNSQDE
jgi:hypothetical protein